MSKDRWQRADEMSERWDRVHDALEDAYQLITDGVMLEPTWLIKLGEKVEEETGDSFDLEGHIVRLSDIALEQAHYWEQRAEDAGKEMLAAVRKSSTPQDHSDASGTGGAP